ncbi:sensor domain-containing diguanylate cyclase [Thalassotalea profundi]|uniref:diguanylate cyclase n=1 Tax=Thalassotalea profundi TaxID=2036687 RepID=A0ABQ3J1S9_9GAMM|nr:diguanylate cyclase [Thalassotalea profundi]GHE98240.1 hypothetical protein GCM10011501_29720 [Thalassotalea profundi]
MTIIRSLPLIHTLFFLCLCLINSSVYAATPIQITNDSEIKLEQFEMAYFVDKSENMPFEQVQGQNFTKSSNRLSLGTKSKTTWIKIQLHNVDKNTQKLYLHHPYAYHNSKVELYEVEQGVLSNVRVLDMDKKETQQWMYRGSAVFDFTLQPNQQKTLFVKSLSFSHQWFALNIYDENQSKRALLGQFTNIALVVGMLLALIIYNFLLFFSSRLKEHFYYACYLVSGGFWIALSYGLFADLFNIFGSVTIIWHLSLVTMPFFLLLFMINIFETKKKYPIEHWALVAVLILLVINFIHGLFDIVAALDYSSTLAAIMMLASLSVSLSMLIRRHPMALFFLIGHGLFVAFSTLAVLFYKGIAEFNYVNSHGVGIGIALEALVLSLIIAYRIRTLEKLKSTQADLQLLASTDPLTKLFNRRHFNSAAVQHLDLAEQTKQTSSIALIDIDHFKSINDTYGHTLGDKSIKCVANIIKNQSRQEDILARYGGEEFIILMPNTNLDDAFILIERIRKKLESTTIEIDTNQSIQLTISAGIAEVNTQDLNLQEAINQADKALYKSKNNGRNQSQLFKE